MPIDLLADEPIDLLAGDKTPEKSFYDLSDADQQKVMDLARQKIGEQYPNMPHWMRDMILQITPRNKSPMLESAARGVTDVTNYIPAAFGGALQGASIPIRGVASMIPTEFTQNLANSPDLRSLFPQAEGTGQKSVQTAAEIVGSLGPLGKMFGLLKGGTQLARVPKALQNASALAGTGYIGTPGDSREKALGAVEALALGGAGKVAGKVAQKTAQNVPSFLRGLTSKSTPEALVEAAQKPHDILQRTADELYGQVRSGIKKRGISIPVKPEYLAQAEEILPKTRASRQLIDKARSGDYEAVHDLQSHLYKKGTKGLASDDIALENQGEEIIDLRNKINDDLEQHLIKNGHVDIAHVLRQGKNMYKKLMDTYFHKNLPKGIGKLVHQDLRLIPENPVNLFKQNSVPMKRFLEQHPEVAKHSKELMEKEKAMKDLKRIMLRAGIGGGTIAGGKSIYDLLK